MYQKLPKFLLILAFFAVILWIFFTYLLPVAMPFLLGGILALLAEPIVGILQRRLPRTAAATIGVSGVFLLSAAAVSLLFRLLLQQLSRLKNLLPQAEQSMAQALSALRQWLLALAPQMPDGIHRWLDRLAEALLSDGSGLVSGILSRLPKMATGLLGYLSQGLLGLLTGIIAGYMLSARLPSLRQWLRSRIPESWRAKFFPAVKGFRKALGGWLLAEVKLAGIAFVLLAVGLLLLRVEHWLLLAVLITAVDAFPVLGVGTVLIPWSILRLIQGDPAMGIGLLALYGVIWLVRSALEPTLLGKELGLDPLVTLLCVYGGLRLWGVGGMLFVPMLAMGCMQVYKQIRK